LNNRSDKNAKVYKFKPKNQSFNYKDATKREFPKGPGDDAGEIDLMMIFGMEGEAKNKDPEQYDKVRKDLDDKKKIMGRQEYLVPKQRDEFLKRYKNDVKSAKRRVIPTFLMLILCVALEVFVFYNESLFARISVLYNNAITPLVALQVLLFICAINYKKFLKGLGIFVGRPSADSVLTVTAALLGAYYVFLALMGASGVLKGDITYNLYLTPVALLALYSAVAGYVDSVRVLNSFRTVSAKEPKTKHVLTVKTRGEDTLRHYSPDGGNVICVEKTGFPSDFVKWNNMDYMEGKHSKWLIGLSVAISFGLFLYEMITQSGLISSVSVGVMTMMLTMPFSLYFSYSFIFGYASVIAKSKGCAVIGDGAFEEYPSSAAVYFDDTSVFPSSKIKLKGFRAYGDNRIDKMLYILSAIYKKLESPAARLFERAVGGFEGDFSIDILDVSPKGVRVAVNGGTVFVGGADYMSDCGFTIEDAEEDMDVSPEVSVVYMALGHSVVMKAYLEYTLDKNVIKTAQILKKHGMYLGICTCDPCINDEMMNVRIPLEEYPVGIMKGEKTKPREKDSGKIGGGIVSVSGADNLLSALLTVIRASHAFKTDMIIKAFTFLSGAILSVLFALFGQNGGVGIWYMIFYQIFAVIPTVIMLSTVNE